MTTLFEVEIKYIQCDDQTQPNLINSSLSAGVEISDTGQLLVKCNDFKFKK